MVDALRPDQDSKAVGCERTPDGIVIRLTGEIDMSSWPLLDAAQDRVVATDPCPVTADLSAATFIDSYTLGFLVRVHTHVTDTGHQFVVSSPTRMVARAIEVTGLGTILTIQP